MNKKEVDLRTQLAIDINDEANQMKIYWSMAQAALDSHKGDSKKHDELQNLVSILKTLHKKLEIKDKMNKKDLDAAATEVKNQKLLELSRTLEEYLMIRKMFYNGFLDIEALKESAINAYADTFQKNLHPTELRGRLGRSQDIKSEVVVKRSPSPINNSAAKNRTTLNDLEETANKYNNFIHKLRVLRNRLEPGKKKDQINFLVDIYYVIYDLAVHEHDEAVLKFKIDKKFMYDKLSPEDYDKILKNEANLNGTKIKLKKEVQDKLQNYTHLYGHMADPDDLFANAVVVVKNFKTVANYVTSTTDESSNHKRLSISPMRAIIDSKSSATDLSSILTKRSVSPFTRKSNQENIIIASNGIVRGIDKLSTTYKTENYVVLPYLFQNGDTSLSSFHAEIFHKKLTSAATGVNKLLFFVTIDPTSDLISVKDLVMLRLILHSYVTKSSESLIFAFAPQFKNKDDNDKHEFYVQNLRLLRKSIKPYQIKMQIIDEDKITSNKFEKIILTLNPIEIKQDTERSLVHLSNQKHIATLVDKVSAKREVIESIDR